MYTITVRGERQVPRFLTSGAILLLLCDCGSSEAQGHFDAIDRLEREGTKYSNQDFDILSATLSYLRRSGGRNINTTDEPKSGETECLTPSSVNKIEDIK